MFTNLIKQFPGPYSLNLRVKNIYNSKMAAPLISERLNQVVNELIKPLEILDNNSKRVPEDSYSTILGKVIVTV